jgi:hypothetical protein
MLCTRIALPTHTHSRAAPDRSPHCCRPTARCSGRTAAPPPASCRSPAAPASAAAHWMFSVGVCFVCRVCASPALLSGMGRARNKTTTHDPSLDTHTRCSVLARIAVTFCGSIVVCLCAATAPFRAALPPPTASRSASPRRSLQGRPSLKSLVRLQVCDLRCVAQREQRRMGGAREHEAVAVFLLGRSWFARVDHRSARIKV